MLFSGIKGIDVGFNIAYCLFLSNGKVSKGVKQKKIERPVFLSNNKNIRFFALNFFAEHSDSPTVDITLNEQTIVLHILGQFLTHTWGF